MATDCRNNGQITQAVHLYKELLRRFDATGNAKRAANMQHMIGVSYKVADNTLASLTALAHAKQRYQQIGDTVGVGCVLRDEGITYQYNRDYRQALRLLKQSVMVLKKSGDFAELGISQAKVGNAYMEQGDLPQAKEWLMRGLHTLTTRADHWFYTATTRLHVATLY